MQEFGVLRDSNHVRQLTEEAIGRRFTDMFKAFRYLDIDNSGERQHPRMSVGRADVSVLLVAGTLTLQELQRGLELWNIPLGPGQTEQLLAECDKDGDGLVSFEEVQRLRRTSSHCPYLESIDQSRPVILLVSVQSDAKLCLAQELERHEYDRRPTHATSYSNKLFFR